MFLKKISRFFVCVPCTKYHISQNIYNLRQSSRVCVDVLNVYPKINDLSKSEYFSLNGNEKYFDLEYNLCSLTKFLLGVFVCTL